jgi:hypothetical protein
MVDQSGDGEEGTNLLGSGDTQDHRMILSDEDLIL